MSSLIVFILPIDVVIGRVLILNRPYQHLLRIGEKAWTVRVFVVQY